VGVGVKALSDEIVPRRAECGCRCQVGLMPVRTRTVVFAWSGVGGGLLC
jgi:hypothetical protein